MKALELFEKYPKAGEVVIQYYADKFLKSVENTDVPEEFKEFAKQQRIDDRYVADFIDNSPRGAFDVFDEHGIYITTPVSPADGYFKWEIETDKRSVLTEEHERYTSDWVTTRKEAEAAGVEKAFEILNYRL